MTDRDVPSSVDRVPTVAWAMAWLFLAGQAVVLLARGANSSDLPWVLASMALSALARGVRELAVSAHPTHRAMTAHPHLVGGPDRDVTRLMRAVPGLMAKDGAEGVYVAALPDGRAVALKIADGAGRARLPVMVAALTRLGVGVPSESLREPVLGHGRDVGSVRALIGP